MTDDYYDRLVDEGALEDYLETHLGPADTYTVEHHQEGFSNETLFCTWGDRELVIRRPPPGETAETAHDVLREYRVTKALSDHDCAVPVPQPLVACENHEVIGSEFYVMDRLEGDVCRWAEPDRFADPAARREVGVQLVDTLVAIHDVDHTAVGLDDFGRPAGYTPRQVERWRGQLEWAFERTREERAVPTLEDVGAWLEANVPEDHPETLVHGDYKLDNVMFGPGSEPRLVGVFDWEMSTLGDPRFDLGWMLAYWRNPDDPEPAVPELMPTFMEAEGYPSRAELVDRYERESGRSFPNDRFYRTLAVYKLAALGEMFFRRHLEGNSDNPMYPLMETRVPSMAERAQRIIDGEEPL